MPPHPSIAIIGAGAVGGYFGARLAQHGHNVHFLARRDYAQLKAHGFAVGSVDGDFSLAPHQFHVHNDVTKMPQVDLIIVALKSTENRVIPNLIAPLLHDHTAILTLQNGLGNEQFLADHFGPHRVLGAVTFACINRIGPGQIQDQYHGFLRIGEFATRGRSERCYRIVRLFTASNVSASAVEDLKAARWDKQVWNVPFNGLSTLLDATTDQLIGDADGERLVHAVMNEVIAAARADGVTLAPDVAQKKIDATRSMGAYLTSTHLDRRHGRPMEIEAIFGQPVHIARRANVPVPLLELLYFSLRRLDLLPFLPSPGTPGEGQGGGSTER